MSRWMLAVLLVGCGDDGGTTSDSGSELTTSGSADGSGEESNADTADPGGSCVPFDGTDDCGDGMFCLPMTATEGQCTQATAMGSESEELCGPSLSACAEDRICQPISNGTVICVDMCRFAMGDDDCAADRTCSDAYDLEEVGACAPEM